MLRVQVYYGGTWVTIADARRDSLACAQLVVDATTKDSQWWSEALASARSVELECEALAGNPDAYRAAVAAINGNGIDARIIDGSEVMASFRASIALDMSGPYDGEASATFSLRSMGQSVGGSIKTATPTISPAGGALVPGAAVSLACATPGASIFYSVDGSAPSVPYATSSGADTLTDPTGSGYVVVNGPQHTLGGTSSDWYQVTVTLPPTTVSGSSSGSLGWHPTVAAAAGSQVFTTKGGTGRSYIDIVSVPPPLSLPFVTGGGSPVVVTFWVRGTDTWYIDTSCDAATTWTATYSWSAVHGALVAQVGAPFTVRAYAIAPGMANSDEASASFAVSLADSSKWVGAWDFTGGSHASVVTGSPVLASVFPGYTTQIAPLQNDRAESYPTAESARINGAALGMSRFSFAAFVYQPSSVHLFYLGLHNESAGAALRLIGDGRLQGASIISGAFAADYSARYHLALTYDGSTARVYKNGVLAWSGAASLGAGAQRAGVYFGYASGAPIRYVDNFCLTGEVLSPAAVSALAAGHLPDSSGVLI